MSDPVREDLLQETVGDEEGAAAGLYLLALAPRLEGNDRPRCTRCQPQQRLDPAGGLITGSANVGCRTGIHGVGAPSGAATIRSGFALDKMMRR